jgi:hypothetical protein
VTDTTCQPRGTKNLSSSSTRTTKRSAVEQDQGHTATSSAKRQHLPRFTREEHEILNEALIYCRKNGVQLKVHATRLAEQMNRPVQTVLNQLSPTLRCTHMSREKWETVKDLLSHQYRARHASLCPSGAHEIVKSSSAPAPVSAAVPHGEVTARRGGR